MAAATRTRTRAPQPRAMFTLPRGVRVAQGRPVGYLDLPYPEGDPELACWCSCADCSKGRCLDCDRDDRHDYPCPHCQSTTRPDQRQRRVLTCRYCLITWDEPGVRGARVDLDTPACHAFGKTCHLPVGHESPCLHLPLTTTRPV